MDGGIHADGIAGADLDAETTNDASKFVDDKEVRVLFDGWVVVFGGFDVDAVGGTDGGTAHAGDAADLAVVALHEAMHTAVTLWIGNLFFRVLYSDNGTFRLVGIEVAKHVRDRNRETTNDFWDIGSFQKIHWLAF